MSFHNHRRPTHQATLRTTQSIELTQLQILCYSQGLFPVFISLTSDRLGAPEEARVVCIVRLACLGTKAHGHIVVAAPRFALAACVRRDACTHPRRNCMGDRQAGHWWVGDR